MTNEQLAELIQQGGNDELLPLLWEKTRGFIFRKCDRIYRVYKEKLSHYGYNELDIRQEGYGVMLRAVKAYDSAKGYKLLTYTNYALKGVMRDVLAKHSDMLNMYQCESLDEPIYNKDGEEAATMGDLIEDTQSGEPFNEVDSSDYFKCLYECVKMLPEREREAIKLHYFQNRTYKDIAALYDISSSRAMQIVSSGIRKLRKGEVGRLIRTTYGEDYGFSIKRYYYDPYDYIGLTAFKNIGCSSVELNPHLRKTHDDFKIDEICRMFDTLGTG